MNYRQKKKRLKKQIYNCAKKAMEIDRQCGCHTFNQYSWDLYVLQCDLDSLIYDKKESKKRIRENRK